VHVRACSYVRACVCHTVYVGVRACVCVHAACMRVHVQMHWCMSVRVCVCVCVFLCACVHVCVCLRLCVYVLCLFLCEHL